MFACIWFGVPRDPINTALLRGLDWAGLCFSGIGFSLLYAGLDQGNRLDWTGSGLIVGLLAGGAILTIAFLVRELTAKQPFVNLRLLLRGNLPILLLILAGLRYIILSTAYIIPNYLQTVQNFRELQIGKVLLWIALPQFVIVVPLALLLRKTHGRATLALGVTLIGIACLMTTRITADWATDEFLPSQILQAIGQSFALTAFTVLVVRNTVPSEALMIGSLLQTSRLFGGEIGTASMQTYVRVQEQIHSHYIGNQVVAGDSDTLARLAGYQARIATSSTDGGAAIMQSYKMLSGAIATQANVLAYQDGFASAACGALACLFFTALLSRRRRSPF
jgi:DHA2 family multidrug resistance protein